jgi:hypothetical protein
MMVTRVRLPRYLPISLALLATAGLLLVAGILIQTGVLRPPCEAGEGALPVGLLGGAAVYFWQYQKINSGRQDLVIDEGARTFQLPLTYKRPEQTLRPISQIQSVLVNKVRHARKGGRYYTYLVTLKLKDNSEEKLIDLSEKRAESLAAWLMGKLGLRAPACEVEAEV